MTDLATTSLPSTAGLPRCIRCEGRPPLERYRRYEVQTLDPLWFCPRCYGFWAVGDALSRGVSDPYDEHPALRAVLPPRACKDCVKPLKPDGHCPACGRPAHMAAPCPSCGQVMEMETRESLVIDRCTPCRGTWFDTGEIVARFGLVPVQGAAARMVDETAPDPVPSSLLDMAILLLRLLVLRF